ncbi:MAG: hypothetical protein AAGH67_06725 [Cyanobacteria bacterium P01_H01_bin.162]
MLSTTDVTTALNSVGISSFGLAMPTLARDWAKLGGTLTADTVRVLEGAPLTLVLNRDLPEADNSWLAPMAGLLRPIRTPQDLGVTLTRSNGSMVTTAGWLLTLFPQAHLRLKRLYVRLLEQDAPPERASAPLRPVPRYFFYDSAPGDSARGGNVNPGDELNLLGQLTLYDEHGLPIDPVAVLCAFQEILRQHPVLQAQALGSTDLPDPATAQISQLITTLASGDPSVRVWLGDGAGQPYGGDHLTGLTTVSRDRGVFSTTPAATTLGQVQVATATGDDGEFPPRVRRLLRLGLATEGSLTDSVTLPPRPTGVTLQRDFFSLRVVNLKPWLLGEPNTAFLAPEVELAAAIRTDEPLTLLADGNDVLGAAGQALAGSPAESLVVGEAIAGDFALPSTPGDAAHWPNFPAGGPDPDDSPLPVALRESFAPTAAFFDDGDPARQNTDVVLTLNGLPPAAAVRVYPRRFLPDARESRGNGAGGVVPTDGQITLRLPDPFDLRQPGQAEADIFVPASVTLMVDVMVVKRNGSARLYGNVTVPITTVDTAADVTLPSASNPLESATRRGICNAGVLGLSDPNPLPSDPLAAILALTGEGTPRDASRFPTMVRRDLIVASRQTTGWQAVLSGGRLTAEAHSAQPRLGAPASPGGRESQRLGVASQTGRLAYDFARMAFRRTTNIVDRMVALADADWQEPPALSAGGTGAGTFAGAVLQTVAPRCETPELSLLRTAGLDPTTLPRNFDALVDWLKEQLGRLPAGTPSRADIITELESALDSLKDNDSLSESDQERLFNELYREIISSCYGRRDTQWALARAISQARQFIYIETPGLAATHDSNVSPIPPYAVDLWDLLAQRLRAAPGLHVILCTPKHPDFGPGYEPLAAWEAGDRFRRILGDPPDASDRAPGLPTANQAVIQPSPPRVLAFHPIGFPGRPSRLETTTMIVDDSWALVGSSTLRRRGLTFDGSSDLVFTDLQVSSGRSSAIAQFRRALLAERLGITPSTTNTFGTLANHNYVRLDSGVESFDVINEMLKAGGLGKIESLWDGREGLVNPLEPDAVGMDLANPDGQTFNPRLAIVGELLARLNSSFGY